MFITSFLYAVPIGILGGLIGLGGAEFRLPVLVGKLQYSAHKAIILNLIISLITVITSIFVRYQVLDFSRLALFTPILLTLTVGAMISAFFSPGWIKKLSDDMLKQAILIFLVIIGLLLIVEDLLPQSFFPLAPSILYWQVSLALLFGLIIGVVSSLLGVAGGEIIIPTLVLIFGLDIKLAGTGSLLISLPTILVGISRHLYAHNVIEANDTTQVVLPMGIGSVIGALIGSSLIGIIPATLLKISLGLILNLSAYHIFRKTKG